ncbi:MAG: hypothetical protein BWY70_00096 [Bacteroidetes bacterium ADurb.Bin408]|nr:MAG: hypothetical protein BWY70_00096 [Bacteroidetes bacterium ADurb.Bin408]
MQNDKLPIGQFCRELVEDFDQELPPRVWAQVSSALDNDRKKRRTFVYWSVAAPLALLISFSAGYYLAILRHRDIKTASGYTAMKKETLTYTRPPLTASETQASGAHTQPLKARAQNKFFPVIPQTALTPGKVSTHETTAGIPENTTLPKDSIAVENESLVQPAPVAALESEKKEPPALLKRDSADLKSDFKNIPLPTLKNETIANKHPEEKEAKDNNGNWALAEHFSPVFYMGSSMKAGLADEAAASYSAVNNQNNDIMNNNKTLLVYATGVSLKYQVGKKWRIGTGVFYAAKELCTGLQHRQLDVPLTAGYGLINRKFTWELNSGFSTNVLLLPVQRDVNYSALLGTTFGYRVSEKISVNVEPVLKYNFLYPSHYIFHYYPFSAAVYTGLSYRF